MAQLNVEPKKSNWWVWVLVIIAIFLLWWIFMRKDNQMNTKLTPIRDSTTKLNDSTAPMNDTAGSIGDSTTRIERLR